MGFVVCLQCDQRKARTRAGIAFRCKQGWLHYSPQLCEECVDTLEGTIDAMSPKPAQLQSELPFAYGIRTGA